MSTSDAADFLSKLTKSFINFIIFDFVEKFQGLFDDPNGFINSQTQLKSLLLPRVSDVKFGSFKVGLSVDTLNPIVEGNAAFFNWQREAIEVYENDIFNLNYNSISNVNSIVDKYPLEVRKAIFNPLFEITNNPKYTVKTSNRLETVSNLLSPVSFETRKIIVRSDQDLVENEPNNLEFMTFVMAVPQGSKLDDINTKKIRRNVLSISTSDTKDIQYQESFTLKGRIFNFINPLSAQLYINGQILILKCDVLSIEVDALDQLELYSKFKNEIYTYYVSKVINNINSPEAKVFQIYFDITGV